MEKKCQYSSTEICTRTSAIQYILKHNPVKKKDEGQDEQFADSTQVRQASKRVGRQKSCARIWRD